MPSCSRIRRVAQTAPAARLEFAPVRRWTPPLAGVFCLAALSLSGCAGHHAGSGGSTGASPTPTPSGPTSGGGNIATIAGVATAGAYAGDGGPAISANLNDPTGTFVDSSGNLYIADRMNNVVRLVTPAGIISAFAGNGTAGYAGDGGAATSAEMSGPDAVFGDSSGNIYVVEGGNIGFSGGSVVRKINSSGIISTVIGNGTPGFAGDGGAGTSAQLSGPKGGCIDGTGNIYVADTGNNRIRKLNTSSGLITTIFGTGTAGYLGDGGLSPSATLDAPTDVKADALGNIYVADRINNRVRKVNVANDLVTTVAGSGTPPNNKGYSGDGGLATAAVLNLPTGLAVDSSGNIYIADEGNNVIREVIASTGNIATAVGNGSPGYAGDGDGATSAEMKTPAGVAVDSSGDIFIADSGNNVVREVAH